MVRKFFIYLFLFIYVTLRDSKASESREPARQLPPAMRRDATFAWRAWLVLLSAKKTARSLDYTRL